MGQLIDITGKRFGKLVVLHRLDKSHNVHGNAQWTCQCDCGNQCIRSIGELKRSKCASCGCFTGELLSRPKVVDLLGKRFGNLTVIGREKSVNHRVMWRCLCDCGNK